MMEKEQFVEHIRRNTQDLPKSYLLEHKEKVKRALTRLKPDQFALVELASAETGAIRKVLAVKNTSKEIMEFALDSSYDGKSLLLLSVGLSSVFVTPWDILRREIKERLDTKLKELLAEKESLLAEKSRLEELLAKERG